LRVQQEVVGAVIEAASEVLVANSDVRESVVAVARGKAVVAVVAGGISTALIDLLSDGVIILSDDQERVIRVGFENTRAVQGQANIIAGGPARRFYN
jgi:hypothetical protein